MAISIALSKPAPSSIPRSGEAGRRMDCFSVRLDGTAPEELQILVKELTANSIDGNCWSGDSFEWPCSIPNVFLPEFKLNAVHYYGLQTHTYNNGFWLVILEYLHFPLIAASWRRIRQVMFNSTTPARTKRMDALRDIYDLTLQSGNDFFVSRESTISSVDLLHKKYGHRIWDHPLQKSRLRELTMVLDSLVETKDLNKKDLGYAMAPTGLKTMSDFEESERKQRTSEIQTWLMIILTLVVAAATVIQAFAAWRGSPPNLSAIERSTTP